MDKFFYTKSLWLVFLIGFLVTGTMSFSLFHWLPEPGVDNPLTIPICLKIGLAFGLVFGAFWTLIVHSMRQNKKFWDYAKHVEELLELAHTKEEVKSVERDEWPQLVKLCQDGYHVSELQKLYAVMKVKYNLLS